MSGFDPVKFLRGGGVRIMGIVNATGDSFSEGAASAPANAGERAAALIGAGADIIDIGGESTRPGADEIAPAEELERVLPVLRRIRAQYPTLPISVDTRHGVTAAAVLAAGADIINDVGMLRDAEMAAAVARSNAVLVLCHSRGTPLTMNAPEWLDYGPDPVATVAGELRNRAAAALEAGVRPERIWYDPGCGFAKTAEQNWELIRRVAELTGLGPVLVGVSRKSFIGRLTGEPDPLRRLGGTLATELCLARSGVRIIRTHAVRELRDALKVLEEIFGKKPS